MKPMPTPRRAPVRNNPVILYCASAAAALVPFVGAHAQAPAKPVTQDELLRQIESLNPPPAASGKRTSGSGSSGVESTRTESRGTGLAPATRPLFAEQHDEKLAEKPAEKPEKKSKGPTEIVALEATFDQKAHLAIFIGQVVVTDPEFIVQCDKLTTYLKHDDKPAGEAGSARLKAPTTPATTPKPDDKKAKGGGLEKAIAEANPGSLCTVIQEKKEADGSTSRSIGHGKKVHYDAITGDITLTGKPDVQQGINTCVATDESTIMILNRDGHMRVTGPHKTVIKDQGDLTK
ncbi:MAG: LptA/OstA family protein [Chthoniobacteraceae bacterium]